MKMIIFFVFKINVLKVICKIDLGNCNPTVIFSIRLSYFFSVYWSSLLTFTIFSETVNVVTTISTKTICHLWFSLCMASTAFILTVRVAICSVCAVSVQKHWGFNRTNAPYAVNLLRNSLRSRSIELISEKSLPLYWIRLYDKFLVFFSLPLTLLYMCNFDVTPYLQFFRFLKSHGAVSYTKYEGASWSYWEENGPCHPGSW